MSIRDDQILRKYLANRDVPCPDCGYNLRGLEQGRCPECGLGFNLGAIARVSDCAPLTQAMWDIDRWWWALVVNFALYVVATCTGVATDHSTWFDALTEWPGTRHGMFYTALLLGCVAMRWINWVHEADPALAARMYMKVAVPTWALTGVNAVGTAWELLVAALS